MPGTRMDHRRHDPGTVADCDDCRDLAYEPGWYRAMQAGPDLATDLDDLLVVLPEPEAPAPEGT